MPEDDAPLNANPIVAAAMKIRRRRDLGAAVDSALDGAGREKFEDAEHALHAFAERLQIGVRRLNSILGKNGVKFVSLARPLRLRLRFGEKRVALDLDEVQQLVRVSGLGLDGSYQFDPASETPALINLSIISTEAGYGEPLTPSKLLKVIAQDAELPRPAHLDGPGPIPLD